MNGISVGDVVKALSGRDKENYFLVVEICGKFAFIADGKRRKIQKLKKKNIKHLIKAAEASMKSDADRIRRGEPFGNVRLCKKINRAVQNK